MKQNLNDIILIPTDFSEVCENAVEHGLVVAKNLKFRVFLLHVINSDTEKYLKEKNLSRDSIAEKLDAISKEKSEKYGVSVEYIIKSGDFFKKISKVSAKIGAKLIILGTHGKLGFQKITGSFALKVITMSRTPTIVVQKKSFQDGYKNIVFPITAFSEDRQKVLWAVNIARRFDAKVHLIPKFATEKLHKKQIMNVTKQIKTVFDEYGVKYTDDVRKPVAGNFAKQVIDYAVENNAELIMTIVHEDQMLPIFTSMDDQLIFNSSQIPVICINPAKLKNTSWH